MVETGRLGSATIGSTGRLDDGISEAGEAEGVACESADCVGTCV